MNELDAWVLVALAASIVVGLALGKLLARWAMAPAARSKAAASERRVEELEQWRINARREATAALAKAEGRGV